MTTEENLVYQLLDVLRAFELNNDEAIGERDIRAMLIAHRAELINKYSIEGIVIMDMCFQSKILNIISPSANRFTSIVPSIIFFKNRAGVKLTTTGGGNIPIVSEESFDLGQTNPINKNQPKAKIENHLLTVSTNAISPYTQGTGSQIQGVMDSIEAEEDLILKAVFLDPQNGDNYNWTTSEYPFPSEYLSDLKKNILRREFNIVLSTKSDQVPNMKNDTLRYHDQSTVQR